MRTIVEACDRCGKVAPERGTSPPEPWRSWWWGETYAQGDGCRHDVILCPTCATSLAAWLRGEVFADLVQRAR